jgi:hypothetical protein
MESQSSATALKWTAVLLGTGKSKRGELFYFDETNSAPVRRESETVFNLGSDSDQINCRLAVDSLEEINQFYCDGFTGLRSLGNPLER